AVPAFVVSPDGKQLAYTRARGPTQLWLVSIADPESPTPEARVRRIANDAAAKVAPALSPDGQRISYTAADGLASNVFVLSIDGGQPQRLAARAGDQGHASWSAAGTELALL